MLKIIVHTNNGNKTFGSQYQVNNFIGMPEFENDVISPSLYEIIKIKKGVKWFCFDSDDEPMSYKDWLNVINKLQNQSYDIIQDHPGDKWINNG